MTKTAKIISASIVILIIVAVGIGLSGVLSSPTTTTPTQPPTTSTPAETTTLKFEQAWITGDDDTQSELLAQKSLLTPSSQTHDYQVTHVQQITEQQYRNKTNQLITLDDDDIVLVYVELTSNKTDTTLTRFHKVKISNTPKIYS